MRRIATGSLGERNNLSVRVQRPRLAATTISLGLSRLALFPLSRGFSMRSLMLCNQRKYHTITSHMRTCLAAAGAQAPKEVVKYAEARHREHLTFRAFHTPIPEVHLRVSRRDLPRCTEDKRIASQIHHNRRQVRISVDYSREREDRRRNVLRIYDMCTYIWTVHCGSERTCC